MPPHTTAPAGCWRAPSRHSSRRAATPRPCPPPAAAAARRLPHRSRTGQPRPRCRWRCRSRRRRAASPCRPAPRSPTPRCSPAAVRVTAPAAPGPWLPAPLVSPQSEAAPGGASAVGKPPAAVRAPPLGPPRPLPVVAGRGQRARNTRALGTLHPPAAAHGSAPPVEVGEAGVQGWCNAVRRTGGGGALARRKQLVLLSGAGGRVGKRGQLRHGGCSMHFKESQMSETQPTPITTTTHPTTHNAMTPMNPAPPHPPAAPRPRPRMWPPRPTAPSPPAAPASCACTAPQRRGTRGAAPIPLPRGPQT